jgi:hypothetical protein
MTFKTSKLPKVELALGAALFTAGMIAMWSGTVWILLFVLLVRRQRPLDRPGGLNKGEFLAHRNVHRSEDETATPTIAGTS